MTKTIVVKVCRKCKTEFFGEGNAATLYPLEELVITKVTINHCTVCSSEMDKKPHETSYHRRPVKDE